MRILLIAIAALALIAAPLARAQDQVPVTDVGQRAHVAVNAGGMFLTTGADWSGASLGGALGYNVHPQLSLFAGYDHGFPINSTDDDLNLYRLVGNLRVHSNAFFGFGWAWFDRGVEGGLAQLVVTKQVMPRVAVGGMYAHVFSRGDLEDFEYARAYVNYHLLGKE